MYQVCTTTYNVKQNTKEKSKKAKRSAHLAFFVYHIVRTAEPSHQTALEKLGVRVGDVLHDRIHEETDGQFVLRGVVGVHNHALEEGGDRLSHVIAVPSGCSRESVNYYLVGELAHLLGFGSKQPHILFLLCRERLHRFLITWRCQLREQSSVARAYGS